MPSPAKCKRYYNHPCAKWAAASSSNFIWLWEHGKALCEEYTCRYEKVHKYTNRFSSNELVDGTKASELFPQKGLTPFIQCMLPEYFDTDPIVAYRYYYIGAKSHLLKYTRRQPPQWMQDLGMGEHKD